MYVHVCIRVCMYTYVCMYRVRMYVCIEYVCMYMRFTFLLPQYYTDFILAVFLLFFMTKLMTKCVYIINYNNNES